MQAQRQNVEVARRLFTSALREDAAHMPSIVGLAVLEARSGNRARAQRLYRRGLELEPGNIQALHASAQMHLQAGEREVGLLVLLGCLLRCLTWTAAP